MADLSTIRTRVLTILLVLVVVLLPFMICDLYYGFNDNICLDEKIQNFKILFQTNVWLIVKGFFDLFSILVYVAIGIALFVSKKIYRTLQWLVALFFLGTLVRFVWLVIGACMYWGYLWPSNLCKPAVDAYMWIMLLFNMIIQFIGQCIVLAFLWRFMAASSDATEYEDAKPKGTVTEGPFELKVQQPRPYDADHETYHQAAYTGTPMPMVPQAYQQGYYTQQTTVVQQPYEPYYPYVQQPTPSYQLTQNYIQQPGPPAQYPQFSDPAAPQYLYGSQVKRYQP